MKISCEQCSTVYELDARLIPPAGAPVQCTRCGHVFTALPDGSVAGRAGAQAFGGHDLASADDEPPEGQRTAIYGVGSRPSESSPASQTRIFGAVTPPAPEQPIREGTLMFGKLPDPAPSPATTQVFGAPQLPTASAPPIASGTQIFGAVKAPSPTPPVPSGTQIFGAVKVPPAPGSASGPSTQIFGAGHPSAPGSAPGTSTQIFGAGHPSVPGSAPGTSTQIFGAVKVPPAPGSAPGTSTQIFGAAPSAAPRVATQVFGAPAVAPPPEMAQEGPPREKTLVFGGAPVSPAAPAASPAEAPQASKPSSTQIFGTAQIDVALAQGASRPGSATPPSAQLGSVASPVKTQLFGAADIEAELAEIRAGIAPHLPPAAPAAPAAAPSPDSAPTQPETPAAPAPAASAPPGQAAPTAPALDNRWADFGTPPRRTGEQPAVFRRTDEMSAIPRPTDGALAQPRVTGERPALGQPRVTGERPALGQPRRTGEHPTLGHPRRTGEHPAPQPRRTGEHVPVELPPEGPPPPLDLGLGAVGSSGRAAETSASSGSRIGLLVLLAVALAAAGFFGYRILAAKKTAASAPVLAALDSSMSLLRRDDSASQKRAYDQLFGIVRDDPKLLEAQADMTLALALRYDDFRLSVLRMQREADLLDRKITRVIDAHATSDWQNRVTSMRDERRALQEQINQGNAQLTELETRLNNAFAALPTQPIDQPTPREELALLRAQAVYHGVRGSEQAMILADRYHTKSPNDGWDTIALAEYALNARASPDLLDQCHKGLDTLISRDSSFLRAYVLSARVALTQKRYDVASNALEAVIALNPQHDLAPKLLSWTRQVERSEATP